MPVKLHLLYGQIPMSFDFPTLDEIIQRIQNDIQNEIPESNPFLLNSFIRAIATSYAARFDEFYVQFQVLFNALFLDSTSGEFIDRWGSIFGFTQAAATSASGFVNFEGVQGSVIPINTLLQGTNSVSYETEEEVTIGTSEFLTANAVISGTNLVTVSQNNHGLRDEQYITTSNTGDAAANGDFAVTVIDDNTFTYNIVGGVDNPITVDFITIGTISFRGVNAVVSGIIVTVTQSDHGYASGITVAISNASDATLNGDFVIAVVDINTFTYTAPDTETVGPVANLNLSWFNGATVTVIALTSGAETNLNAGPQISLTSAIAGVDTQAYIQFGGLAGGSDLETDDEYRTRIITRLQNPIAEFSSSSILEVIKALKLSDQTVIVSPTEEVPTPPDPAPGQVVVIVVIIETSTNTIRNASNTELEQIKDAIDKITPANIVSPLIDTVNVDVTNPEELTGIDVNIPTLIPSTDSMQEAIAENLAAYFIDNVTVSQEALGFSQSVQYNQISAIVQQTIDPESGKQPTDFEVETRKSDGGSYDEIDISIDIHARAVLNSVTFIVASP